MTKSLCAKGLAHLGLHLWWHRWWVPSWWCPSWFQNGTACSTLDVLSHEPLHRVPHIWQRGRKAWCETHSLLSCPCRSTPGLLPGALVELLRGVLSPSLLSPFSGRQQEYGPSFVPFLTSMSGCPLFYASRDVVPVAGTWWHIVLFGSESQTLAQPVRNTPPHRSRHILGKSGIAPSCTPHPPAGWGCHQRFWWLCRDTLSCSLLLVSGTHIYPEDIGMW